MIARHTSTIIIWGTWKHKVYFSQVLEGTLHTQAHTARSERERERGLRADLELCFFRGSRVGNLRFFR